MLDSDETYDFQSKKDTSISPLAQTLFSVNGVTGVFLARDFVTVTIGEILEWSDMEKPVSDTLRAFFASGREVLIPSSTTQTPAESKEEDSEVVSMIKELINTRIRPSVQEDGGDIKFIKFDKGVVHLQMQGSCVGCPSSEATLKHGIQNMLMHYIPEVLGVEAWDTVEPEVHEESKRVLEELEKKIRTRKRPQ